MVSKHIPHFLKCRNLPHLLKQGKLIPLTEWAKENNYGMSAARDRIAKKELIGKKLAGRWYVLREGKKV